MTLTIAPLAYAVTAYAVVQVAYQHINVTSGRQSARRAGNKCRRGWYEGIEEKTREEIGSIFCLLWTTSNNA